jgi:hypothetical protein
MTITYGFSGSLVAKVEGKFTKAAPDGTTVETVINKKFERYLKPGSDVNEAQKVYTARHTIGASGTLDLDFAAGMNDPFGVAQTFARIKLLMIIALDTNTNNVNVGGTVTNQMGLLADPSDVAPVPPGGVLFWDQGDAGRPITAATGDLLRIANSGSGSAVNFDIVAVGT